MPSDKGPLWLNIQAVTEEDRREFLATLADKLIQQHASGKAVGWDSKDVGFSPGKVFLLWGRELGEVLRTKGYTGPITATEEQIGLSD
jgi:hypothetical protein